MTMVINIVNLSELWQVGVIMSMVIDIVFFDDVDRHH
ncbi:hypothetical protein PAQ31011_00613 [Pandoraea aquatica]|uniref:Uncharacterized protein n=1 Tax=Pandoraea aquatica TaxID=2508290 RepID=A0A5E4SAE1_9BURK|nr:hypothetical protein PAQ31011_00613 [Pandoraea aquatica]